MRRGHLIFSCVLTLLFFMLPAKQANAFQDLSGSYVCNVAIVIVDTTSYSSYDCYWDGQDNQAGGGSQNYEGGYGGGGGSTPSNTCSNLRMHKPAGCENEIQTPSSAEYGYGASFGSSQYANGSGLPKLIYLKNNGPLAPGISSKINNLLQAHTQQLAQGFISRKTVDKNLTDGLRSICLEQNRLSPYPSIAGTKGCLTALNRLVQEQNDSAGMSSFSNWLDANNYSFELSLGWLSLDLKTLIAFSDPANSLEKKYSLVDKDSRCATWWSNARSSGCVQ